jgi:hypothetical protein
MPFAAGPDRTVASQILPQRKGILRLRRDHTANTIGASGLICKAVLSSGHAELVLISDQDRGFSFSDGCGLDVRPEPVSRLARRATRRGLGLDAGEDDVMLRRRSGDEDRGPWGRSRGQRVVTRRRVVEADMRGLVTAGPCVRLERCAGLSTSVARFPFRGKGFGCSIALGARCSSRCGSSTFGPTVSL